MSISPHEWVISMRNINESHRTHARVMTDHSFIWAVWRVCKCDMTHWYSAGYALGSDVFCHALRHDSFKCATWLVYKTHSYGWYDASVRALRLINITREMLLVATSFAALSIMTHSYVRRDSFISLIHMGDMTHAYGRHDSSMCVTCHFDTTREMHLVAMSFTTLSVMTRSFVQCDSFIWLIHIGSMTHL